MPLKNSQRNYGLIARSLHWLTAALFLAAYCAVYYRHWFTESRTTENMIAFQLHLSFGITIGVVVLLRLLWRLYDSAPESEATSWWANSLARIGHLALYAVMIIMPLTGYLGTGGNTNYFFLFEIPRFQDTALFSWLVTGGLGMTFEQFEAPVDFIHKQLLGQWLAWLLIAGHALAALYHHYILQDRTLKRMTSG
ncbi:cytochrome b [Sedimenticola thiotaurini]|uniref:Cytochrome B561 n=1 Tax=Sedimenticola thiotaurini TaxID=1543721 RepID=A0A0F7JXH4_9GAMM|nr:cytochrome b [Sedimenticola thiotaurini]AKH20382.1 cytochrome B561 [Sedimenticola thiotaurini]